MKPCETCKWWTLREDYLSYGTCGLPLPPWIEEYVDPSGTGLNRKTWKVDTCMFHTAKENNNGK